MSEKCKTQKSQPSAVTADGKPQKLKDAAVANIVRLWEGFEGVVLSCSSLHLNRLGEEGDEEVRDWTATILPEEGGKRVVAQAASFMELVAKLVDGRKEKVCSRCRESKLLTSFSLDRSKEDGRCRACRRCESIRVMSYQKKGEAKKVATAVPG